MSLDKPVSLSIDPRFIDLNGYLSLPRKPRPYKFCIECGEKVINGAFWLRRHFERQHKDIDFDNIKFNGYLQYGAMPNNTKYVNFAKYLHNMDIELKYAAGFQ